MADSGLQVPAIEQRPSYATYEWLWEAFLELTTDRQITMGGVGPIPWSAVNRYATALGLNEDERYLLHYVIRDMDTKYLKHINADRSAKRS